MSIGNVISDQSPNYIFDVVSMSVCLTSTVIVFIVSKHWKKAFVYLLPPLLVMTYAGMNVKIWLL